MIVPPRTYIIDNAWPVKPATVHLLPFHVGDASKAHGNWAGLLFFSIS